MFEKIRIRFLSLGAYIREIPAACVVVPALLLCAALVIRLCATKMCVVYTFKGGIGLFPGTFIYTLGYALRIVLCGIILASAVFSCRIESRIRAVLFSAVLCAAMLCEFKLIFFMCRFFLAAVMCLGCAALAFLSLANQRRCARPVAVCAFVYILLQCLLFIQLLSLIFCL